VPEVVLPQRRRGRSPGRGGVGSTQCIPDHPLLKREVCGANAIGTFNRADFGVNAGLQFGFRQEVTVRIQVEAIRQD
jgi:polyisoprenoid-binding protein YceI